MGVIYKLVEHDTKVLRSGQIITDLSSLVKELVENSLDADATVIHITIDAIGRISVKDNGIGIARSDIASLSQPHHTSKLRRFAYLQNVRSYGFRGEALSAIASLSRSVRITTRTVEDTVAKTYERSPENSLHPIGTSAEC